MRHLSACLTVVALAGTFAARADGAPSGALAITGVTVIDATEAPARPGMTVVVTGDRITAVGKSGEVRVPEGARVVDGKGKYLIPGLWDMHVHTADRSYLTLYVANGVTGVRDMHALDPDSILGMRRQVQQGKEPGPRIVAAGPLVDGPKPLVPAALVAPDAREGREAVRKFKNMGADFVKVYTKLPREAYLAIVDEVKSSACRSSATSPSRSAPPRRPTWVRRASSTSRASCWPARTGRTSCAARRSRSWPRETTRRPGSCWDASAPRPRTPSARTRPRPSTPASSATAPGRSPP
jgi:hypothetical protein